MALVKRQTFCIDSSLASYPHPEDPTAMTLAFEPQLVACRNDERLEITLERFFTVTDWYWLAPGLSLTFYWGADSWLDSPPNSITLSLPAGNPRLPALAQDIAERANALLPPDHRLLCEWDAATNRFLFAFPENPCGLMFRAVVARALGFDVDDRLPLVQPDIHERQPEPLIVSDRAVRPLPVEAIRLDLSGVTPARNARNGANLLGDLVTPTSTLAVIPVTNRPFTLLDWQNTTDGSFKVVLADRALSQLSLRARHWDGRPLPQLGRYCAILRVDTFRNEDPLSNPHDATDDFRQVVSILLTQALAELKAMRVLQQARALDESAS